jgi:hypothetical protein
MSSEPVSNPLDILRAHRPPLNDQFSVHWSKKYAKEKNEFSKIAQELGAAFQEAPERPSALRPAEVAEVK